MLKLLSSRQQGAPDVQVIEGVLYLSLPFFLVYFSFFLISFVVGNYAKELTLLSAQMDCIYGILLIPML